LKIADPKTGDEKPIVVSVDDGIRPNTSLADLGKLKAVFKKDGTTTAGKQHMRFFFFSIFWSVYFNPVDNEVALLQGILAKSVMVLRLCCS
jgi:hypothetical protein